MWQASLGRQFPQERQRQPGQAALQALRPQEPCPRSVAATGSPPHALTHRTSPGSSKPVPSPQPLTSICGYHVSRVWSLATSCVYKQQAAGSRRPCFPSSDHHLKNIREVESQDRQPLRWALLPQDTPSCRPVGGRTVDSGRFHLRPLPVAAVCAGAGPLRSPHVPLGSPREGRPPALHLALPLTRGVATVLSAAHSSPSRTGLPLFSLLLLPHMQELSHVWFRAVFPTPASHPADCLQHSRNC